MIMIYHVLITYNIRIGVPLSWENYMFDENYFKTHVKIVIAITHCDKLHTTHLLLPQNWLAPKATPLRSGCGLDPDVWKWDMGPEPCCLPQVERHQ